MLQKRSLLRGIACVASRYFEYYQKGWIGVKHQVWLAELLWVSTRRTMKGYTGRRAEHVISPIGSQSPQQKGYVDIFLQMRCCHRTRALVSWRLGHHTNIFRFTPYGTFLIVIMAQWLLYAQEGNTEAWLVVSYRFIQPIILRRLMRKLLAPLSQWRWHVARTNFKKLQN